VLATDEKALFALEPTKRIVPTTMRLRPASLRIQRCLGLAHLSKVSGSSPSRATPFRSWITARLIAARRQSHASDPAGPMLFWRIPRFMPAGSIKSRSISPLSKETPNDFSSLSHLEDCLMDFHKTLSTNRFPIPLDLHAPRSLYFASQVTTPNSRCRGMRKYVTVIPVYCT